MKTPLILTLTIAATLPLASAQDERKPEIPPRPADAERPPGAPRERRPEGDRPSPDSPERGRRPDGDRGPDQRRPDGPRPDGQRPEGRKPDGGPEGERRDGPKPDGDRRDGPRPEGDRRDGVRAEIQIREGGAGGRAWAEAGSFAPRPQKPTAYLGVVTTPVEPALAAQLGLPEGIGLVVDEVVPDSPAARAGVQRFDVIKQLNDQQLVDPNQLATLVRNTGKDAEVSLTILRKGAEQKLALRVGERLLPERRPLAGVDRLMPNLAPMRERAERGMGQMQERMEKRNRELTEQMEEYQERMKEYGHRLREFQERAAKDPQNPGATPPQPPEPPKPPRFDSSFEPAPADVLKQVRPGGAPGVRVEQDGNVTVWNTANARAVMKDDDGEVELRSENGKRSVTARDAEGKVTFTGPIDTEEQRAALPESVRRKLGRMDVRSQGRGGRETLAFETPVPAPAGEREIQ